NVPEREGAKLILASLTGSCKKLRRIWVDGGYRGQEFSAWIAERFRIARMPGARGLPSVHR
ncbi:MAG: hypothetical protein Q7U57_15240, partial [Methylovulum sp.]|nr:hypothetical protein [Methylovulum sp.]